VNLSSLVNFTSYSDFLSKLKVKELQAEIAHQRAEKVVKTALEEYCDEYPEAKEIYDTWCSG
jgi:hypothetical protein